MEPLGDPEAAVRDALQRWGITHEVLPCDPEAADTAAFCARYGFPAENTLNTILVVGKTEPRRYAACVVRASTLLDVNRAVRKQLGASRASFAPAEETVRLTGMQVGGVTPFGLPEGIPVLIDEGVMGCPYVILGSGGRTAKLRMEPAELLRVPNATVVPGLAHEKTGPPPG